MLLQRHVKDPGHSARNVGGRLHLNTHAPVTQQSRSGLTMLLFRKIVRELSGNKLTCNLSRNIRAQLSELIELPWTDPGIKNGISMS